MKILHLVLNNYENDNRVRRAAECGHRLGAEVFIFALSKYKSQRVFNENGVNIRLLYLTTRFLPKIKYFQIFKYLEIVFRMFFAALKYNPTIIHAHDLNTLPIGRMIAKVSGAKLIYDSHEYWADVGVVNARYFSKVLMIFEKYFLKKVDVCITVSSNIAELIEKNYSIPKPIVVRNVPEQWKMDSKQQLRLSIGISTDVILILYQGYIVGNGVHHLKEAFKKVKGNAVLVFLGNGEEVESLKQDNFPGIYFHPSVTYEKLASFTSDADIGVLSIQGINQSKFNALPNKMFEYINGGLALVASNLPEMRRLIDEYNMGLVYTDGNIDELADSINKLVNNYGLLKKFKINSRICATEINWENEKKILEDIYLSLKF